ncbi:hypothetical protein U1Q18_021775, partial [Sarracenia purpurea var. burkii]
MKKIRKRKAEVVFPEINGGAGLKEFDESNDGGESNDSRGWKGSKLEEDRAGTSYFTKETELITVHVREAQIDQVGKTQPDHTRQQSQGVHEHQTSRNRLNQTSQQALANGIP